MNIRRVVLIAAIAASTMCVAGSSFTPRQRSYGSAIVKRFIEIDGEFTFRCDLEGFPAIIGQDIPVRIDEIVPPATVADSSKPNLFYEQQLARAITDTLTEAEKIELKNIRRGDQFNLLADVYTDNQNLALMLIRNGLARRQIRTPKKTQTASAGETSRKSPETATKQRHAQTSEATTPKQKAPFIASKTSKIFHKPTCRSAKRITDENSVEFQTRQEAIDSGRRPCKSCSP